MMKSDVLDSFATIKACTAYKLKDGAITRDFPYDISDGITPVYEELQGWNTDLTTITSKEQFPGQLVDYIHFLEKELETPIAIVSVGPDREQTIVI
jgi:adenylosuccinate synthase